MQLSRNIKLILLGKILPVIVIYTDKLPEGSIGITKGILIKINKKFKNDNALLKHEITHVKQFYRTLGWHYIKIRKSMDYRYKCEVEAYAEQLKCNFEENIDRVAGIISSKYNITIDKWQAEKALREFIASDRWV